MYIYTYIHIFTHIYIYMYVNTSEVDTRSIEGGSALPRALCPGTIEYHRCSGDSALLYSIATGGVRARHEYRVYAHYPVGCSVLRYCSGVECSAVCCSVLQCNAVCCSVMQFVGGKTRVSVLCALSGGVQCAAVYCSVLRFCSALQCVAVCCSVVQCGAVWCSVVQCVAVWCSALLCGAVCCSVVQCVAVCGSMWQSIGGQYASTGNCNCLTLQRTATHMDTLQHTVPRRTAAARSRQIRRGLF